MIRNKLVLLLFVLCLYPNISHADSLDDWILRNYDSSYDLRGVAFGNNLFVAVGKYGVILTSTDGVAWTNRVPSPDITYSLNSVTFGKNMFVAVGTKGKILTSADGISWTSRTTPDPSIILNAVTHGNDLFVAVGANGIVFSSADGLTWVKRKLNSSDSLNSITFDGGTFMTAGGNSLGPSQVILTSRDGIKWTKKGSSDNAEILNDIFSKATSVCVGNFGTIMTSSDATNWTAASSGTSRDLNGVSGDRHVYVAVGNQGVILTSPDGLNWTRRTTRTTEDLNRVIYADNSFVAVGAKGTILQTILPYNCIPYLSSDLTLHLPRISAGNVSLAADLQYVQNENGKWLFKLRKVALENQYNCVNAAKLIQEGGSYRLHVPSIPIGETAYRVDLEYAPTTDGSIWFRLTNANTILDISEIVSVEVTGTDTPLSAVVTDKDRKEALGILTDKDLQGNPQRMIGVVYTSAEGVTFLVRIGADGLPYSMEDTTGNTFKFLNYTDNTVDVKVYDGNGTLVGGPFTVPVDEYQLSQLKQMAGTFTSLNTTSFATNFKSFSLSGWQVQQMIKAGSLSVGIVSCGVAVGGIVAALGTAGIASPLALAGLTGCASTIVSAYAYFSDKDLNSVSSGATSGSLCAASLLAGQIPASCVSLLADIAIAQYADIDTIPPRLVSSVPADGATVKGGLPRNISLKFNEPMKDSRKPLYGIQAGIIPLTVDSCDWSDDKKTVTCRLRNPYNGKCEKPGRCRVYWWLGDLSDVSGNSINVSVGYDDEPPPVPILDGSFRF